MSMPPPLPQLESLVKDLKQRSAVLWARRALKAAFVEWRDRAAPPGVAARFTRNGEQYYWFAGRYGKAARKTLYLHSGALRRSLLARPPRHVTGSRDSGRVAMRYSMAGGALNFLSRVKPTIGQRRVERILEVAVPAQVIPAHQRITAGRTVNVSSYERPAHTVTLRSTVTHPIKAAQSWADQFGFDRRDTDYIIQRYRVHFLTIVRAAAFTPKGKAKAAFVSRHLEQHDGGA